LVTHHPKVAEKQSNWRAKEESFLSGDQVVGKQNTQILCLSMPIAVVIFLFFSFLLNRTEKKNYAGSEYHSPHYLRKRSHFGTEYRS